MRLFGFASLLLGVSVVRAQQTLTLEEVNAQIEAFQKQQNASLSERSSDVSFGCSLACSFLGFTIPNSVALPDSPAYIAQSQYWSQQQAQVHPACRFSPSSATDVSLAVLTLRVTSCKFAVKSGGHAAFSGASNIESGVTIDLGRLNQVVVNPAGTQTAVGAGNVWFDVYTKLTPKNLTVIGGRVSAIGVGGLTLGGGMSFFSARYGWACDNVNAFEVVFADGTINKVTPSANKDLYWALRGGGNNFGIVTRFDLATYPQGDLWAGARTLLYTDDNVKAVNEAFTNFARESPKDPFAQVIIAYAYAAQLDTYIIAEDLQYGKPVANPPILQNFTAIPGAVADTLRIVDLPGLTQEFNATNPNGFRQTYWTFTVGNDAELMNEMVAIYKEEVDKIKDIKDVVPAAIYQPITTDMTKHFTKNGGNPLGLAGQGPLNLVNIDISWSNTADDARALTAAQNIVNRSVAAAKAKGLYNKYLYQNYAALQQGVFASYGADNLKRLRQISDKYDPAKVWQKLQPGYFKLG